MKDTSVLTVAQVAVALHRDGIKIVESEVSK